MIALRKTAVYMFEHACHCHNAATWTNEVLEGKLAALPAVTGTFQYGINVKVKNLEVRKFMERVFLAIRRRETITVVNTKKQKRKLILKRKEPMTLTKDQAVTLLLAMRFDTADKWDVERIEKKLNTFATLAEDEEVVIKKTKMQERFNKIVKAIKKGQQIVVDDKANLKGDGEGTPMKKTKKKKVKKTKTKKAPKKKTEVKVEKIDETEETEKPKATKKKVKKTKTAKKETTEKKTVAKRKTVKGKSNKQAVYDLFTKVKPENAAKNAEKWYEKINGQVKLTTIKGWISMWKNGNGLPRGAEKTS